MKEASRKRPGRGTNIALLVLLPLAAFTGLFANTIGIDWVVDPALVHAMLALAIAILSPWKAAIVRLGLSRRRPSRWLSLILLALVAITLMSGLLHATDLTNRIGPLSVMQVHVGAAVGALLLVALHYRSHPVRPRTTDLGRRNLIKSGGLAVGALAFVGVWELALGAIGLPGARRRFTGSHERSSFDPRGLPSTVWLDDRAPHADVDSWAIDIDGREVSLTDIAALPHDDVTAILDCTSGWFSEQVWTGVRLDRVVDTSAKTSIEVRSSTGYARRFPVRDVERLWLVTAVGGEPLARGHGFPARIVAPDRRGFWWVKWVDRITTSDVPWWVQSPFPVT